jgi:hypothetical protein
MTAIMLVSVASVLALVPQRGSFELVVCRWGEDVEWVRTLGVPHVIYDKGKGKKLSTKEFNVKHIDVNVGKENFCYLAHILQNYDQQTVFGNGLAKTTFFTQANPFDHANKDFVDMIKRVARDGLQGDWFRAFGKKLLTIDEAG